MSLGPVVAACGQPQSLSLPIALRDHLQNERLDVVTSVRGLPLGVRDGLQTLFGNHALDIADPDADFAATDVISPTLASRRLIIAGCSTDHCLISYERAGSAPIWHVVLFHWTPQATRFEWGGTLQTRLATLEDLRRAVLSGSVKDGNAVW